MKRFEIHVILPRTLVRRTQEVYPSDEEIQWMIDEIRNRLCVMAPEVRIHDSEDDE